MRNIISPGSCLLLGFERWHLLFIFVCLGVVLFPGCADDFEMESCTETVYEGDPDIFMMGQSNANSDLAYAITMKTGRTVHQISHGRQPIESWLEWPRHWLQTDVQFLGKRSFKYFLWFQGESNVNNMLDYEDEFHSIVSAVSPDAEPIVIIVGIWLDTSDTSKFRQLQQDICARHENYYFVDSMKLEREDGVHLSYKGQKVLAGLIEERILEIETGVPAEK